MPKRLILIPCLFLASLGSAPNPERALAPKPKTIANADPPAAFPSDSTAVPREAERRSEHFLFLYDPKRMTPAQVDAAVRTAEESFKEVAAQFPQVRYTEPVILRLSARFRGATGFAAPGGKSGKGKRDYIGLRYEELPTLGLTPEFLFRHEITHLFAGRWVDGSPDRYLSGSPLGEGIADLVAGGRNRLGLPLSFVKYLQQRNAWISPERLFLRPGNGRPPSPKNGRLEYEDVFMWRIARYVEPSLFLNYVKSRVGWEKLRQFYIDDAVAAQSRNPADNIRTAFRRNLGALPEDVFAEWRAEIAKAPEEAEANRMRYLSERAYAGVQWYDFLAAGKRIPEAMWPDLDSRFRTLHADIAARKLDAAERELDALLNRVSEAAGQGNHSPLAASARSNIVGEMPVARGVRWG